MHAVHRAFPFFMMALLLLAAPGARAEWHSPETAFLVALGPGAIFHGLGNRHAGERKTANILFVTEIFGLALLSLDHADGPVERQLGDDDRGQRSGSELATLGQVLFFGSWLYDMGSASDAARRHQARRQRDGLKLSFEPRPEPAGGRVSFNPRAAYTVRF